MTKRLNTPILSLDIDAMRVAILKRLYEVMKPFQTELANLDLLEAMLTQQAHTTPIAKTTKNGAPQTKKRKYPIMRVDSETMKAQIMDVLNSNGREPMRSSEILEAIETHFKPPYGSQATLNRVLNLLREDGMILRKKPALSDGDPRYPIYLAKQRTARQPKPNGTMPANGTGINAGVLRILKKAPAEGFDRGEIVTLSNGQYDRQHVTWALNGLVKQGFVKRHLHGKPADTRFTLAS